MTSKIEIAFNAFHAENPHVYNELVRLARHAKRKGLDRWSIASLFEIVRWETALRTSGSMFKLNNNYKPYYARLIMANEENLRGFFRTRDASPQVIE